MLAAVPGAPIEGPADDELDQGGRHQHGQLVVAKAGQAQIPGHAEQDQGHGEQQPQEQQAPLAGGGPGPPLGFPVLDRGCLCDFGQLEAGGADDGGQFAQAGHPWNEAERELGGAARGHLGDQDPVLPEQQSLKGGRFGRPVQTQHGQGHLGDRHLIAKLFDAQQDFRKAELGRLEIHDQPLSGQIHRGPSHPGQLSELALDQAGTAGAAQAQQRQAGPGGARRRFGRAGVVAQGHDRDFDLPGGQEGRVELHFRDPALQVGVDPFQPRQPLRQRLDLLATPEAMEVGNWDHGLQDVFLGRSHRVLLAGRDARGTGRSIRVMD